MLALFVDFRLRILIAALVALTLFATSHLQIKQRFKLQEAIHYLGKISYSLFLVHFSVLMLSNSVFSWLGITSRFSGMYFMLITWAASLLLADFFYRKIENPAAAYLKLNS